MDWADVLKTVGSTTAIAAVLGFLGQVAIKHLLHRDIDAHKFNLKRESDLALAEAKAQVERELTTNRARADAALLVQKAIFDNNWRLLARTLPVELSEPSESVRI